MLAGGPVMVPGRGERLTPVHVVTTWWVLKPFDVPRDGRPTPTRGGMTTPRPVPTPAC